MNSRKTIDSPHVRKKTISQLNINAGRKQAEAVKTWMEAHRGAFFFILNTMQHEKVVPRPRDYFANELSRRHLCNDKPLAFNNNYWAGIARYLVLVDPSLEAKLNMRDSDIDCWGLYPVSYLEGEIKHARKHA